MFSLSDSHRYDYLSERLSSVERILSKQTVDVYSGSIENYVHLQCLVKQEPMNQLSQCDNLHILNEQMIHPGMKIY